MGKYFFLEEVSGSGGPVSAADVSYGTTSDPNIENVKEALDKLLYVSPSASMSGGGSFEIGQTVHGVHLTWNFNKAIVSQSLDNGIGNLALDVRAYDWPDDISSNLTFTLTASDGQTTAHASTSVQFYRRAYWGVSSKLSLDNADILAFSQAFATNRNRAVVYDCSGGRYPYFCYPKSFGALSSVTVGGLAFSDYQQTTLSLTNASGHLEDYYVTRFNGIQFGDNISVSWA